MKPVCSLNKFLKILFVIFFIVGSGAFGRVVGREDREEANRSKLPAKYMGKIPGCTANLIEKSIILTAGHCLDGIASGTFYLRYKRGDYDGEAYIREPFDTGHFGSYGYKDADHLKTGKDWAIASLSQPLGNRGHLTISPKNYADVGSVSLVGYSTDWDRGRTPSYHRQCLLKGNDYSYYLHDCDSAPGSSGGAVVEFFRDEVLAINTGQNSSYNFATPFSKAQRSFTAMKAGRLPPQFAKSVKKSAPPPRQALSKDQLEQTKKLLELAISIEKLRQVELRARMQRLQYRPPVYPVQIVPNYGVPQYYVPRPVIQLVPVYPQPRYTTIYFR